jgi:hypothetical protein
VIEVQAPQQPRGDSVEPGVFDGTVTGENTAHKGEDESLSNFTTEESPPADLAGLAGATAETAGEQ